MQLRLWMGVPRPKRRGLDTSSSVATSRSPPQFFSSIRSVWASEATPQSTPATTGMALVEDDNRSLPGVGGGSAYQEPGPPAPAGRLQSGFGSPWRLKGSHGVVASALTQSAVQELPSVVAAQRCQRGRGGA